MRRAEPLLVLLGYAAASLLLLGRHLLRAPEDAVVGSFGADQGFFAWSFVHWVEALAGNQAPFLTDRIDAPVGFNLAWATTLPGPAILLAPLTALAGPLVTYNALALAAPALAAWTAYLLCRRLTGDPIAAIVGGWAFGFSSYLLSQTLNHLNLALVAALPLIALVAIRLAEGSIGRTRGVLAMGGLIGLQFLVFLEVAATATLLGTILLVALLVLGPASSRRRIVAALPWYAAAYGVGLAIAAPLLVAALARSNPIDGRIRPDLYPLDLQNLVVPTAITWIGGERLRGVSAEFAGNITEQTGYVGVLLLAAAGTGAIRWRARRWTWAVVATVVAATVLALGHRLAIGGEAHGTLPWDLVARLPLIGLAIPSRIMVFAWLGLAVLLALLVARRRPAEERPPAARLALAAAALALLLPSPGATWWRTELRTPPGIATGSATAAIPDDAVVLLLPYSFRGTGMHWQAIARMRYRQAGGYSAAAVPEAYARFPIVLGFYADRPPPDARRELLRFLAWSGTTWVLVDARRAGPWTGLLREAGGERSEVDGVIRFRFDPEVVRAQLAGA
jgi:hypothetical protein